MINRLSLSILTLLFAWLFYAYRYLFEGVVFDSAGTFLHVIALTLLSSNFISKHSSIKYITLLWVAINIGFEYGQAYFNYATFDMLDIYAALAAAPVAYILARYIKSFELFKVFKKSAIIISLFFGSALIMGSYDPYGECKYDFVYEDLDSFRESVKVQSAEEISNISATHIYGNYIFLVESGRGIHVLDQSNIEDIKNIRFINIPGVLHVEVQNQSIFADSLMDLVVVDISNISDIKVSSRLTNVFDYNPWDLVEVKGADRYEFCEYPSDDYKNDGVAVSYKESEK